MTRVSAANGDAYSMGPVQALSAGGAVRFTAAWVRRPSEALKRVQLRPVGAAFCLRRIPSAVGIGVALAIVAILALTLQHLRLERDSALSAGARDVDMRATLLAERLVVAVMADAPVAGGDEIRR